MKIEEKSEEQIDPNELYRNPKIGHIYAHHRLNKHYDDIYDYFYCVDVVFLFNPTKSSPSKDDNTQNAYFINLRTNKIVETVTTSCGEAWYDVTDRCKLLVNR